MNLIFHCSSVALSTMMRHCTHDGSLDDAVSHYKQTPSIVIGRYILLSDTYHLSLSNNFKTDIAIVLV
jgi:hypothetical protein